MGLMVLAAVLSLSNAQIAVVEVAAPATLPLQNVTTGYTIRDQVECLKDGKTKGYGFDKYSGGKPTVLDCKVRCESQTNCVGFQFTYGLNVVNQNQTFSCFPILLADANGCNVAKGGDLKDGRKGNSFWIRDAGPVAAGSEGPRAGWQGDGPAAASGFLPFAGSDCMGGDGSIYFDSKSGKTAAECQAACMADTSCYGVNYNWRADSSTYQRCAGKKVDCTLVSGRSGMSFFATVSRDRSSEAAATTTPAPTTTPVPSVAGILSSNNPSIFLAVVGAILAVAFV